MCLANSALVHTLCDRLARGVGSASVQLSQYPEVVRMLAINVKSPDGMFSSDVDIKLPELVKEASQGAVECILFQHHRFLEA